MEVPSRTALENLASQFAFDDALGIHAHEDIITKPRSIVNQHLYCCLCAPIIVDKVASHVRQLCDDPGGFAKLFTDSRLLDTLSYLRSAILTRGTRHQQTEEQHNPY